MPNKLTEAEIQKLIPLVEQTKWHYQLNKFTDDSLGLINKSVNQARREVAAKLATINPESKFTKQRLETLAQELQDMTVAIQHKITGQIENVVNEVAAKSYPKHADILSFGGLVPNFNAVQLTAVQLKSIVDTPVGGKLLGEWVNTAFTANLKEKYKTDIATGMLKGESYKNLVNRFKTDAFEGLERDMEGLTRTYVQTINTNAMKDTMQANADIMKGWKWNSVYENRTCIRCMSMDAKDEIYPIDGGPQIPLHVNCRCFPEPITKTFRELGVDIDEVKESYRPYTIRGKIDPVTGKVIPGKIGVGGGRIIDTGRFLGSYDDFFKQLPENVQMQMLGPTRFGLHKAGKLPLSKLADAKGNTFLLKELIPGSVIKKEVKVAKFTLPSAEDLTEEALEKTKDVFGSFFDGFYGAYSTSIKAKETVEKKLKARMASLSKVDRDDYELFIKEFKITGSAERELVGNWAKTSGDNNRLAIFLQNAAKEEFDLLDTSLDHLPAIPKTLLKNKKLANIKNGARKFLREMYNETQEQFAKKGITEINLFRGSHYVNDVGSGIISNTLQPMSSFAVDFDTAFMFANRKIKKGMFSNVISTKVSTKDIISFPNSGFGCLHEREIVVLGKKMDVLSYSRAGKMKSKKEIIDNIRNLIK